MRDLFNLWPRRPVRGSSPGGPRFRAELETLEDRATPSITPPFMLPPPATLQQVQNPPSNPVDRAIETLYENLLGRPADAGGHQGWLSQYNAGTPMKDIVLAFEQSREYAERFVQQQYQQILNRPADPVGLAGWSAKIMAGESTDAVLRGLMLSPEYAASARSNAVFVSKAYHTLLGREADSSAAAWVQGLDGGGSREAFLNGLLDSVESRDRLIRAAYETYLWPREASDADLSGWRQFLAGSGATPAKFLAELLNGDEFLVASSH